MFTRICVGFCAMAASVIFCNFAFCDEAVHPPGLRIEPPASALEGRGGGSQVIGPRGIYAHDTELSQVYGVYSGYMADIPFDRRHRELVILVVARAWDSSYEWWAHESRARSVGLQDAVIEAIRWGRTPVFEKPDEQIIYDYAREMVTSHKISDLTYQKAWDLLGSNMLIKLTLLIGHYSGVAVTLNAHELALPSGVADPLPPVERSEQMTAPG